MRDDLFSLDFGVDFFRTVSGVVFILLVFFLIIRKKPAYTKKLDPRFWWAEAKKTNKQNLKNFLWVLPFLCLTIAFLVLFLPFVDYAIEYLTQGPTIGSNNVISQMVDISPVFFGVAATFVPLIEEWLFRATLLEEFKHRWGVNKALFLSSLLFGMFHLTNPGYGIFSFIVPTFAGFILGVMYLKGGLKLAAAAHCGNNFIQFLLWYV